MAAVSLVTVDMYRRERFDWRNLTLSGSECMATLMGVVVASSLLAFACCLLPVGRCLLSASY